MFKKFSTLCSLITLLLASCSDNKKEDSDSKDVYTVATSADYPPFEFFKDNQIVGFDIDLINAVADKIGIKIDIKDMNFDGILGSLQSKRIDMAISAITPTDERQQAADFSDRYYSTTSVLVCSDLSPVRALPDLAGMIVGVQSGSIFEVYANNELRQAVDNIEIKSLPRLPDLVQELKSRRISCIVVGKTEGNALNKNHENLRIVTINDQETGFAIALPKHSKLTEKVNQALAELAKDGTIAKLNEKWLKQ